jgi:hypothetical protein
MRHRNPIKTMKTVCGKTITYMEAEGENNKMHSTEGPALIYPEEEKKAPEYYLFGIKYSKADWKSLLSQSKPIPDGTPMDFDSQY